MNICEKVKKWRVGGPEHEHLRESRKQIGAMVVQNMNICETATSKMYCDALKIHCDALQIQCDALKCIVML